MWSEYCFIGSGNVENIYIWRVKIRLKSQIGYRYYSAIYVGIYLEQFWIKIAGLCALLGC